MCLMNLLCTTPTVEISYDLASHGVETSMVVRSPVHVMSRGLVHLGMTLINWKFPVKLVDSMVVALANIWYGDLAKYGIVRPSKGPFLLKEQTGRSAVIDVGTVELIKKGTIKVVGSLSCIRGNVVEFEDGKKSYFDCLVLATGYKSTANSWLKNGESLLKENGMPKEKFPNHWKGENGLYCVGLAMRGLAGVTRDAYTVAADIKSVLDHAA